jgi:hypothetical protein
MFLLIRLIPFVQLHFLENDSPDCLEWEGYKYYEVASSPKPGHFLGFYDWLRTESGRVIGIKVLFHDHSETARNVLTKCSGTEWISPDIVSILFDTTAVMHDSSSVDQEFSVARCYTTKSGRVALLFDASELTQAQIQDLSNLPNIPRKRSLL